MGSEICRGVDGGATKQLSVLDVFAGWWGTHGVHVADMLHVGMATKKLFSETVEFSAEDQAKKFHRDAWKVLVDQGLTNPPPFPDVGLYFDSQTAMARAVAERGLEHLLLARCDRRGLPL